MLLVQALATAASSASTDTAKAHCSPAGLIRWNLTTAAAAAAAAAACRLQSCGYKALIVGGWVRDKYLGRRASDIDIATNATPWEVRRWQRQHLQTDLQHAV
jgi:hypothetical protein